MSIATAIAAFQTLNGTITGIASAPQDMPASLNTATLPIALTFPGPATWNHQAIGLKRQFRTYIIRVYVQAVGQGAGVDEGFDRALPILEAMGHAYLDEEQNMTYFSAVADHLGALGGGFSDEGLGTLPFAGQDYRGFTFRVEITDKS